MPHYIRPNKSESAPRCHVFVDCESRELAATMAGRISHQGLRLWCASRVRLESSLTVRRAEASGENVASWWQWLGEQVSRHHTTWVWSHNAVVDATWLDLWGAIDSEAWKWHWGALQYSPFIVSGSIRGCKVVWLDSCNWFHQPLSALGDLIGLPKLPLPAEDASDEDWYRYCQRDVNILEGAITQLIAWVRAAGLGQLRYTAPSQAWNSWRHLHRGPWPLLHEQPEISKRERAGYFGGRIHLGFQGVLRRDHPGLVQQRKDRSGGRAALYGSDVTVYDARGFYPSLMAGCQFPHKWLCCREQISLDALELATRNVAVIAEVLIDTETDTYPARRGASVFYPQGRYWTTLCGAELRQALDAGHVVQCGRVDCYALADLFSRWVDRLWQLRSQFEAEGNLPYRELTKLLSVSLYGKFGQHAAAWVDQPKHPCRQRWGLWIEKDSEDGQALLYRGVGGVCQLHQPLGEWRYAFVPVAAWTTARGRALVREWTAEVGERQLLYSDTDSLHVLSIGRDRLRSSGLLNSNSIGALQERGSYDQAEYRGLKAYSLGDELHAAGISRGTPPAEDWTWTQTRWENFEGLIRRPCNGTIQVEELEIALGGEYTHGRVSRSGWTEPHWAPCEQVPTALPAEDA